MKVFRAAARKTRVFNFINSHSCKRAYWAQEFVLLRVNQTRIWKYINNLVEVLNKRAVEADEEVQRLEGLIAETRTEVGTVPSQVCIHVCVCVCVHQFTNTDPLFHCSTTLTHPSIIDQSTLSLFSLQLGNLKSQLDADYAPKLAQVLLEVSQLRDEVRMGRARERALLLYGLLAMLLLVAGLVGRQVCYELLQVIVLCSCSICCSKSYLILICFTLSLHRAGWQLYKSHHRPCHGVRVHHHRHTSARTTAARHCRCCCQAVRPTRQRFAVIEQAEYYVLRDHEGV